MVSQLFLTALLLAVPDAVVLEHSVTVELCSIYIETTRLAVMPLTGRGVARYRVMTVPYRSGWEEIELTEARSGHWRSGRRGAEATITEQPHRALTLQARLESSMREVVISFPGLETGDTLFVNTRRTIRQLPLADCYSYHFSPGGRDSVAASTFTVINRRGVELNSEWSDFFSSPEVTGEVTRWRGGPQSPGDSHPLAASSGPRIAVSTEDAESVSRELYAVLDVFSPPDPSLLDSVILQAGSTGMELRRWVANNIEYLGADIGDWPGFTPKDPSETLAERAGVCRDTAVLLLHLIRHTGGEAWLAMLGTRGQTPGLVGSRSFDHMVVVIPDGEGFTVLDPSVRGLVSGHSYGLRGTTYLPLTRWGSPLQTIPAHGWSDRLSMVLRGALEEGAVRGVLSVSAVGAPAELLSTIMDRVPGPHRNMMFGRFFGADSVFSVRGEAEALEVEGKWLAPAAGGIIILPGLRDIALPGTRSAFLLIPRAPGKPRLDSPADEELTLRLHLRGRQVVTPSPVDMEGYSCSITITADTLVMRETALAGPLFPDPETIRKTLILRSGTSGRTVILP
jgi:transglutaminase-like putative cysteine protease